MSLLTQPIILGMIGIFALVIGLGAIGVVLSG
jgi:hypothetical protein